MWSGHCRRGALPCNYFLVLSWDTRNSSRLVIHHKEILASVAPNSLYAVVAVYDVTDRESYEAIPWWFAERSKYVPESTIKIMVGNKADKVGLCVPGWQIRRHHFESDYSIQHRSMHVRYRQKKPQRTLRVWGVCLLRRQQRPRWAYPEHSAMSWNALPKRRSCGLCRSRARRLKLHFPSRRIHRLNQWSRPGRMWRTTERS